MDRYVDLAAYNIEFNNLLSGPAPIGRILNYIKMIGKNRLKYVAGYRSTDLNNNVGSAWCLDFMIGLGLIKITNNDTFNIELTLIGNKIYQVLSNNNSTFSDEMRPQKIREKLISENIDIVVMLLENAFLHSAIYKNLSIYLSANVDLIDDYYEIRKSFFQNNFYSKLLSFYDRANYNESARTTTGKNRVPSLVQLCAFLDYCIDNGEMLKFYKSKILNVVIKEKNIINNRGDNMKYYFVNQNNNYDEEISQGYLWAPVKDKADMSRYYYDTLLNMEIGSGIFSNVNGYIKAFSIVTSKYVEEEKYDSEIQEDILGRKVSIKPYVLKHPVQYKSIADKMRDYQDYYGPIDSGLKAKLGYCFKLDEKSANTLLSILDKEDLDAIANMFDVTISTTSLINPDIKGKNIIYYGIPGCGKSYLIDKILDKKSYENEKINDDYEKYAIDTFFGIAEEDQCIRITFHPEYSYNDFVGQIKPKTLKDENGNDKGLSYPFVAGPFTEIMKRAYKNRNREYLLIIEELNRGNAPAIFGDIFQLLDRDNDGNSKYKITNSDLAETIFGATQQYKELGLPSNLYIIGTMNTSDQNVFTMDTAFKRRWNFKRVDNISGNFDKLYVRGFKSLNWGKFRTAVNDIIKEPDNINDEDKQIGAYFLERELLCTKEEIDTYFKDNKYRRSFASKVLMYLWDDVFKYNRKDIFKPVTFDELINFVDYADNQKEIFADRLYKFNNMDEESINEQE